MHFSPKHTTPEYLNTADAFVDLYNPHGVTCDGVTASNCDGAYTHLDGTPAQLMDSWFEPDMVMDADSPSLCVTIKRQSGTAMAFLQDKDPCQVDDAVCQCYTGKYY